MTKLKISDINIGERARSDYGDISALAASIQRYGLLHPIVIDDKNNLIAGERRLRAHIKLGKTEIEVKKFSELSDIDKKEIELEENIQRKELNWQELVLAKLSLHELRQQMYGTRTGHTGGEGWGQGDTALALDMSEGSVSQDLKLAKAIRNFPELMKEKTKSNAFKKYKHMESVLLRQELNKRRTRDVTPNIICGLAEVECAKWADESFDFFITDPPYGQDLDKKSDTGKTVSGVTYEDDPYLIMDMLRKVVKELYRALKPDRHMIIAFSMVHYVKLKQLLEDAGFTVDPTPLIWNKESGSSPSNGEFFPYAYEPAFWCLKGRRGINSTACNMFTYKRVPAEHKYHPLERPQGLLVAWIEAVSFPGEKGGDPFGGGGSLMEACMTTGRECVIVEKDEANYSTIVSRYEELKEKMQGKKVEEKV
jgi:DNA modification methylase